MVIAPPTSIIYAPIEDGVLLALVALAHEKKNTILAYCFLSVMGDGI